MSSSKINNAQLKALVDNLVTRVPARTTFTVSRQSYSVRKIVKLATSVLKARNDTMVAKGRWKDSITTTETVERDAGSIVNVVRHLLVPMLGNDTATLAALKIPPKKARRAPTTEERLAITEKNRATRLARRTMSKRDKAKVKGGVTGVVVTPVTSGRASATSSVAPANDVNAASPLATPAGTEAPSADAGAAPAEPAPAATASGTAPVATTAK